MGKKKKSKKSNKVADLRTAEKVFNDIVEKEKQAENCWKQCRNTNKRMFAFLDFCEGCVNAGLYYYDIYTDVILLLTFYTFGWFYCSLWSFLFLLTPYTIGLFVIFRVWRKEYIQDVGCFKNTLFFLSLPILPLFCDTMMPFYKLMPCLPLRFKAFMNQFTAIRSLTEALLECLPQLGLQIYMGVLTQKCIR